MRTGAFDRRRTRERRLFETHVRLTAARTELEIAEAQHEALAATAEEARIRGLIAETALAQREYEEARRHEELARRNLEAARTAVVELEAALNALLDNLLV